MRSTNDVTLVLSVCRAADDVLRSTNDVMLVLSFCRAADDICTLLMTSCLCSLFADKLHVFINDARAFGTNDVMLLCAVLFVDKLLTTCGIEKMSVEDIALNKAMQAYAAQCQRSARGKAAAEPSERT